MPVLLNVFILLVVARFPTDAAVEENVKKLSGANLKFTVDFYNAVRGEEARKSFISSPLSVSTLFSMMLIGAGGNTAQEISQTLGYTEAGLDVSQMQDGYRQILGENSLGADVANSVWNSGSFKVSEEFKNSLATVFGAEEGELDFSNPGATETINNWVKKETHDKIEKLFDDPLSSNTLLVLVNAIYFKQTWKAKFPKAETEQREFHGEDGLTRVPMMKVKGKFPYYQSETLKAKVLELDYSDGNTSMVIILPETDSSLKTFEQSLSSADIAECLNNLHKGPFSINVLLPRFKLETKFNLIPTMTKLNTRDIFTSAADLSGISSEGGLYVTEAVQKAFVEVNEDGTEAAAASGASMSRTANIELTFDANRPFMFMIRNKMNNVILFIGRYA